MTRDPLWFVYSDDDIDNVVRAPDEATAMALAIEGGSEDPEVRMVTPEEERAIVANERRERAAFKRSLRKPAEEMDVCDPPLGMMAWLSVCTEHGYRCPKCGRFCRQSAFSGAPTSTAVGGARVCHAPSCRRCRGLA